MSVRRAQVLQLLTIGAVGAQAGHLLAYQARFGGSALTLQRGGAHAYFLPTAGLALGAVAVPVLGALLVIAWARLFAGRRLGLQVRAGWRVLDVLPLLFALQLAIYAAQETLEALAYGTRAPPLVDLLLWGALGQLPVAAVGAMALAWISTRLGGALAAFDIRLAELRPLLLSPAAVLAAPHAVNLAVVLAQRAPAALVKRGPPHPS